jgi:serpin B
MSKYHKILFYIFLLNIASVYRLDLVCAQETNSVVEANNQFAIDLYAKYKSENGNIFFSPYSISSALALTYEGARGKTADEMQAVLHLSKDEAQRRAAFFETYSQINREDKLYELHTANALWAQKDFPFLKEYLNVIEQYYGGKAKNLDFIKETRQARLTINQWVEEQTNNKIKDLIPENCLGVVTRLVLTNAVYFKGKWLKQFDKINTQYEDFQGTGPVTEYGGSKVNVMVKIKVPMMRLTGEEAEFNYAETKDMQILELPYIGDELSMLIFLPKKNDVEGLEALLDIKNILSWRNNLVNRRVDIFMPKFKFDTKYFMAGVLIEMGMKAAFLADEADFSGMTGKKDLYINKVIHQAFVDVNEEGTEAAAATAVTMAYNGMTMPEKAKIFRVDHPFIFIIQERKTGNILFMGRVNNPIEARDDHF